MAVLLFGLCFIDDLNLNIFLFHFFAENSVTRDIIDYDQFITYMNAESSQSGNEVTNEKVSLPCSPSSGSDSSSSSDSDSGSEDRDKGNKVAPSEKEFIVPDNISRDTYVKGELNPIKPE